MRRDIHNSEIPALCRACEARHRGVCGALTPEQLTELSKSASLVSVTAGTQLQGDQTPVEHYANIISGVIKLSKILEDGRQQIVGLKFAPDLLGHTTEQISGVNADTATDARLCVFPQKALAKALRNSHDMTSRLHTQSLRELEEARNWMITLGRKTAREKVASFLKLILAAADPERDEVEANILIELPLNRSEMADFLGLTLETVSRQMSQLRKNGVIEFSKSQHIMILDIAALNAACGS